MTDQETNQPQENKKKPRTEKQIQATEKMKNTRWNSKSGKIDITETYDPDNIAIAELWYSNHELAKENRRKRKIDDMDRMMTTRFEDFQNRIINEMQKPLSSFLDRYIEDNYEEEVLHTPKVDPVIENDKEKEEELCSLAIDSSPPPISSPATKRPSYFRPAKQDHDFSRFF